MDFLTTSGNVECRLFRASGAAPTRPPAVFDLMECFSQIKSPSPPPPPPVVKSCPRPCTGLGFQEFEYRLLSTWVTWERYSFPFLFPASLQDYFDVQDLKILVNIISFEIIVASSQHYSLKCFFAGCLTV